MTRPCCYRSAADLAAAFCGECGSPLLRCAAFEECGGLVSADGACSVCVAPRLVLEAAREARVGGALALPLVLTNASSVGRPMFVVGVWTREDAGEWRAMEPSFDRLEAGASAPLTVRTETLERSGTHSVEIALALASRWRWREEVFVHVAGVEVEVEDGGGVSVTQNITYDASAAQTGATIYAPLKLDAKGESRGGAAGPRELPLSRADRLERLFGLRGDASGVVERSARFEWRGFADGHAPEVGPITTADGTLAFGRTRAKQRGGTNDARLLAYAANGALDEDASRQISRRHLGLSITGGRLLLHVESELGAWINGRREPGGSVVALADGDRFSPVPREAAPLTVQVRFDARYDVVESVTLVRNPVEGTPS